MFNYVRDKLKIKYGNLPNPLFCVFHLRFSQTADEVVLTNHIPSSYVDAINDACPEADVGLANISK